MNIIKGTLDPFAETGTEGIIWSLIDETKSGYDGLFILDNGDYLVVLDPEDSSKIVWEGHIDLEYDRNLTPYPMNPQYSQQAIQGCWVHGIQTDVDPDDWGTWFFKQYPAKLVKCGVGHLYEVRGSSLISGYTWSEKKFPHAVSNGLGYLLIKFKNGTYYEYKDVPESIFGEFAEAESKGSYFSKKIKNKYVCERIEIETPNMTDPLDSPWPWPKEFPVEEIEEKYSEYTEWTPDDENDLMEILKQHADNEGMTRDEED
jgi:hypothetical protein